MWERELEPSLPPREGPSNPRDRALRITIPLAGFNLSGGVKSLIGVANALAARHHIVRFLVPDFAANPPAPLHPGVQVRALRSGPSWLASSLRKVIYLARLATTATAGADVCLANYFTTAYAAWLSRALRGDHARLAYNVRGYEPLSHGLMARASLPSRLVRFALAWLSYRLPLAMICTTEWLRDRIGDPNAYVVGHGIDLRVFRPTSARARRPYVLVGVIGRHGNVKGYPDFLRAVEWLPPDLPLRIALATPDAVALPPSFAVEVSQPTDELAMAAFYGECDVFVFPSRAEGFGLPALEAMARGCAVLTSDCGGVRAFARPGYNCLMVAPADPPALAAAIARLVQDADLRVRLAAGGVETARGFGQEAVLDRFCAYLVQLAAGRQTAGSPRR
ncbi:MAG: glycosyltransferase family 4 protein [Chloroflexi bacterium]|nr:glycosyltransferase family 4 protein [Chloroflexota bacterium]